MQQDEIYLVDLWRILVRGWAWFAVVLLFVLLGTFLYTRSLKPQWEATALIQIGQVAQAPAGQDPKVEPMMRVIDRLQWIPFQNGVFESLGLALDSPEARLYRKSLKLEPLPYEGSLVRLTVRAASPQQARQLAAATVTQLQSAHQQLEALPLQLAHARLDEVQTELQNNLAERDRLLQASSPVNKGDAAASSTLASALLAGKNDTIHTLQQTRSDLLERLSANYTYQTSLMWPIYVPDKQAFPNPLLIWGAGALLGLFLGALAAMGRSKLRRIT